MHLVSLEVTAMSGATPPAECDEPKQIAPWRDRNDASQGGARVGGIDFGVVQYDDEASVLYVAASSVASCWRTATSRGRI